MLARARNLAFLLILTLLLTACPKGAMEFKAGRKAELEKDYDTALIQYERALKLDPGNAQYQLRAQRARFAAATYHVAQGRKLREAGQLEPAAAEFEKAAAIDPATFIADQELKRTLALIAERQRQQAPPGTSAEPPKELEGVLEAPPQLQPLSRAPINYRATADSKQIFDTIGKLAGITVIYDPDYQPRRIPVELTNVTLEQALDMVALQTKTFWKPVTSNTILIIPDTQAKRLDYDEQIIRTFYLSNISTAQELTELVTALRNLLDLKRVQPSTAQNAIIIRDTPDKVAVAEKIIRDVDRAKPEVVIQVAVLQARRDRARELGIVPGSSAQLIFTPRNPVTTSTTGGTTTTGTTTGTTATTTPGAIRLSNVQRLSSGDYSLILPGAQAIALLTDATTKIIQNPEVRATDGQTAKLRIGDRVPIATGSFQPGIGGVGINPLVNTQFQFTDVGVNLDITPRVNSNREISLKLTVEVSSVTQRVNIGGIDQPVIGQRRIEHEIRLKEGEVSILGGIIEQTETKNIEGWPGLGQIPFLRYLFTSEKKEIQENEILIVLTPRIVRLPEITAANVRSLSVGSDRNVQVRSAPSAAAPMAPSPGAAAPKEVPAAPEKPKPEKTKPAEPTPTPAATRLRLDPVQVKLAPGATASVNVLADDAREVFAATFLLQFDPSVIEIQDVQHGGFLSSDGQAVAIVHRVDEQAGNAIFSLTRPPETAGISGSGTLVTLIVKGKAKGRSALRIAQVSLRDPRQAPLGASATGETVVAVE